MPATTCRQHGFRVHMWFQTLWMNAKWPVGCLKSHCWRCDSSNVQYLSLMPHFPERNNCWSYRQHSGWRKRYCCRNSGRFPSVKFKAWDIRDAVSHSPSIRDNLCVFRLVCLDFYIQSKLATWNVHYIYQSVSYAAGDTHNNWDRERMDVFMLRNECNFGGTCCTKDQALKSKSLTKALLAILNALWPQKTAGYAQKNAATSCIRFQIGIVTPTNHPRVPLYKEVAKSIGDWWW